MAEDAYLAQRKLLTRDLEALPIPDDRVPSDEAIALASRVGELWGEMTDEERRRFVEEWFEDLRLGRDGAIAVRARETYREIVFSALDAWWRSDPSRHGAATPHGVALVDAVRPEVALISVGAGNRYGHPTPETLAALSRITTFRTDRDGTVEVTLDGPGLVVRAHANGLPPPRRGSVPYAPARR
ncbi:MAG: hypothetical protein E6J35_10300 [Chloroflexi bacterium]|nr:MAG: hypothetical protein E6J35_10300 [Chloroflexota bacterium]